MTQYFVEFNMDSQKHELWKVTGLKLGVPADPSQYECLSRDVEKDYEDRRTKTS